MSRRIAAASVLLVVGLIVCGCASPTARPGATATLSSSPTASSTPTPSTTLASPVPSPSSTSSPTTVDVSIVTYGVRDGAVYATAIVPELVEAGGECTLTARRGDTVLTATVSAVSATSATNCGVMSVAATAGQWSVTIGYQSADAAGVSAEQIVTVP